MHEIEPPTAPPLIDFPCTFPIKVMGEAHENFAATIVAALQSLVPEFTAAHVDMRASSGGKYISLTCSVYVISQDQLDDIYRVLSAHPLVKFAL
jgi:hypothetical protein